MSADGARAQRAALDHLLALVTRTTWADSLVLRGSTAMLAWAGDRARAPGDLDWVAAPGPVPVHPLDPYPYVDGLEAVQDWPEADDGAAGYELFKDEEDAFETRGRHPVVPPEGTNWVRELEPDDCADFARELAELLEHRPETAPGLDRGDHPDRDSGGPSRAPRVRFAPHDYRVDSTWTYGDAYDFTSPAGGLRLLFPWAGDDGTSGTVQIDIALDEPLAESPVYARIPRADGREPTLVRAASPELSLAWKLLWLHSDIARHEQGRGKDLYDAVVLAESPHTRLGLPLLRRVLAGKTGDGVDAVAPERIPRWRVDWSAFQADHPHIRGDADSWLGRLARAVTPVFTGDTAAPVPGTDR